MPPPHPCEGCRYFFGMTFYTRCCNYIFLTGHRRPCLPGAQCAVKELADPKSRKKTS